MLIPRKIFVLWLQGEEKAPPLVKMCLRRWRRLNPTYEVKVLDLTDVRDILRDFPLDCQRLPPQALSDVVRMKLMKDVGGVWVDATVFPVRPLDDWLPAAASTGFFAFRGHRKPIDVDSWFLAATPGHVIPSLWWLQIEKYWNKPRELITFSGDWEVNYNLAPLSFFAPDGTSELEDYPYYWVMYIFTHLLATRVDFRSAWEAVDRRSGSDCHSMNVICDEYPDVTDGELVEAALKSDVQKLSYKCPHTRRWLSLDGSFEDHDRGHGVDFDRFPIPESYDSGYSWLERAKSHIPGPVKGFGARLLKSG